MARPTTLVPGNCYFSVSYFDPELLFPYVTTLKYLRSEVDDNGKVAWLFEEASFDPASEDVIEEEASLIAYQDDSLYQILDFPDMLRTLAAVAIDHPLVAPETIDRAAAPCEDFGDLADRVDELLVNPDRDSLTITIAYTDDGFSLGRRRQGGFEVTFFLRSRIEAEQEEIVRHLFAEQGTSPHEDYLADRGRTRILAFAILDQQDAMEDLCRRVLRDVYGMSANDSLRYSFLPRTVNG